MKLQKCRFGKPRRIIKIIRPTLRMPNWNCNPSDALPVSCESSLPRLLSRLPNLKNLPDHGVRGLIHRFFPFGRSCRNALAHSLFAATGAMSFRGTSGLLHCERHPARSIFSIHIIHHEYSTASMLPPKRVIRGHGRFRRRHHRLGR